MQKNLRIRRKFQGKETEVETSLLLLVFQEEKSYIVYAPFLDLSGYGKSEDEAMQSFEIVLQEFFEYTTTKKTLLKELKRLGWKSKGRGTTLLKPPTITFMAKSNEDFDRIFENKKPTVAYRNVRMPSYA